MTRAEALTAFFNAVDQYMPTHDLIGRSAIRQAGINYASAAAQDAVTSTLHICQRHAALALLRLAVDRKQLTNPNEPIDPRNYPNDWKVK